MCFLSKVRWVCRENLPRDPVAACNSWTRLRTIGEPGIAAIGVSATYYVGPRPRLQRAYTAVTRRLQDGYKTLTRRLRCDYGRLMSLISGRLGRLQDAYVFPRSFPALRGIQG